MRLNDILCDRESDSIALFLFAVGCVSPVEAVEEAAVILIFSLRVGVRDNEPETFSLFCSVHADCASLVTVLDGVIDEKGSQLFDRSA